jgi:hypothetical protein
MAIDERRSVRKPVSYVAWVDRQDGTSLISCQIADASDGGAKLVMSDRSYVPDQFALRLSPTAKTFKLCQVRWRRSGAIGVQFVGPDAAQRSGPVAQRRLVRGRTVDTA